MKVRIAFATDADGNPDVARIGSIEDHPDADAKQLIKDGIAAPATDQDIADWESTQAHRRQVAVAEAGVDLNSLTMDELREQYPAAAEQPSSAKKADLVAAAEESLADDTATPSATDEPAQPDSSTRKTRRNRVSGQVEDVDYARGGVVSGPREPGDDNVPAVLGGHPPITTVAPGAESSPDVDPADRDK